MNYFFNIRRARLNHGFTLIELVVVTAIIGILATVGTVTYNESRKQARDEVRLASLQQVQLALATYRSLHGRYPDGCTTSGGSPRWSSNGNDTSHNCGAAPTDSFIPALVPSFIAELPRDPRGDNDGYVYITDAAGSWYKLMSLETVESEVVTRGHPFARCPMTCPNSGVCADTATEFQTTYAVYSTSTPANLCL